MTILLRKNKIILGKNKNMYLLLFPQTKVSEEIKWELGVIKIEFSQCGVAQQYVMEYMQWEQKVVQLPSKLKPLLPLLLYDIIRTVRHFIASYKTLHLFWAVPVKEAVLTAVLFNQSSFFQFSIQWRLNKLFSECNSVGLSYCISGSFMLIWHFLLWKKIQGDKYL